MVCVEMGGQSHMCVSGGGWGWVGGARVCEGGGGSGGG